MKKIILIALSLLVLMPCAASAQHKVAPGDTLYKIAQHYGMSFKDLRLLNPHITDINKIYPNQIINVREGYTAQEIIDYARSLQDSTKYVYGAPYAQAPTRADCSSWTKHIYEKFGIPLPRTSGQQARTGTPIQFKDIKKGDLLFFADNKKDISHVGIYLGEGYWISNLNSNKDVVILSIWGNWSYSRFMWATRVI